MRSRPRALLASLAVLLCAVLGGFVLACPASAHATLVTSSPVDGARLKAAPSRVTITFDEAVGIGGGAGYLHVTDQTGRRVETGSASHPDGDGTTIAVALKSGLGDGTYTESFRVISADSHPVAGVVRFVVGNGVLSVTSVAGATVNALTSAAFDAVRWISFAGFALLGGSWLLLTVWPQGRDERRARRVVWLGWIAAVAGAAGELLLQGPYVAGLGVSGLTNWSLLDGTLHSDFGQAQCVRLLLLGFGAFLLAWVLEGVDRERSRLDDVAWPLAAAIALTFAVVGHPQTTPPRALSVVLDALHVLAMAAWVGGLVMLAVALLPRRAEEEESVALPVFSRVAFGSVCVLAVTGSYAAWHGVGSVQDGLTTQYGRLVALKVALFVGLIALGYLSRRAVARRFSEQLRRGVLVEIVLAGVVLAASAVLVAQPRGREALAAQYQRPVSAAAPLGGGRTAVITVDPGKHGVVAVSVQLSAGTAPQSVTATASLPSQQIGPIPIALTASAPNLWAGSGQTLPVAGRWLFQLVVKTSEFDATTTQAIVRLH